MVAMNFTFFIFFSRSSAAVPVGSVLSCSSVSIIVSVNTASTDLSNDNQRVRQAFFSFFLPAPSLPNLV